MGHCPKPRKGFSPLTSVGRNLPTPMFLPNYCFNISIMREHLKGVYGFQV